MIDIDKAIKQFKIFMKDYDLNNQKIYLKYEHTLGVVKSATYISDKEHLSLEDKNLAMLIALLHDLGRFEQLKLYNSFSDANIDHAALSCDLLFSDNKLIRSFINDNQYDDIIYKAIKYHSSFKIPENLLNEKELLHARLIRDADKLDNFRVKYISKFEDIADFLTYENLCNGIISKAVFNAFIEKRTVISKDRETALDMWLSFLAFIFDLNFKSSYKYIQENDYINKNINRINYQLSETKDYIEQVRKICLTYIGERTKTTI